MVYWLIVSMLGGCSGGFLEQSGFLWVLVGYRDVGACWLVRVKVMLGIIHKKILSTPQIFGFFLYICAQYTLV